MAAWITERAGSSGAAAAYCLYHTIEDDWFTYWMARAYRATR